MRKKISKRRRRECLRRGVEVVEVKHYPWHDGCVNVFLKATYKGKDIACFAYDELEAWQMARDSMNFLDEMEDANG